MSQISITLPQKPKFEYESFNSLKNLLPSECFEMMFVDESNFHLFIINSILFMPENVFAVKLEVDWDSLQIRTIIGLGVEKIQISTNVYLEELILP